MQRKRDEIHADSFQIQIFFKYSVFIFAQVATLRACQSWGAHVNQNALFLFCKMHYSVQGSCKVKFSFRFVQVNLRCIASFTDEIRLNISIYSSFEEATRMAMWDLQLLTSLVHIESKQRLFDYKRQLPQCRAAVSVRL